MRRGDVVLWAIGALIFLLCSISSGDVPQMINYQGKITTPAGALVDTIVQMTFTIYYDSTSGNVLWADTVGSVAVEKGIFSVLLGSGNPIPDSVFDGNVRYLGTKVGTDAEMSPRKAMVSVGYSYKSEYSDTAKYAHVAVSDGDWTFRITDGSDTTLMTGGEWGIARPGNILYGNNDSTHVNLGVASITGTSGQNYKYCTVAGGFRNIAMGEYATVGGGRTSQASGYAATVGGGFANNVSGYCATVPGGFANYVEGDHSFVAGRYVHISSDADYTFAFGSDFTTSTSHAAIFYDGNTGIKVGIQTTSPTARLDVNSSTGYNQVRMRTSFTPTGTSDTNGNVGDIAWDDSYVYIKTSAGWKRAALSTW